MKVLFDDQAFNMQVFGGISRYFYELIKGMSQMDVECKSSTILSNNHYIRTSDVITSYPFFMDNPSKYTRKLLSLVSRTRDEWCVRTGKYDLFHPTYYNPYFIKGLKGRPFVLTVHDMIHERYSTLFPDNASNIIKWKGQLIDAADKVIAISENTKKDIIEITNVDPSKIEVVYQGFGMLSNFEKDNLAPFSYILFVGARSGYKNFDNFLHAFVEFSRHHKHLHLICTGAPFSTRELADFRILNIDKVVHHIAVDDFKLANLYRNAEFFVFPSYYEGFGIPILEAFAYDCVALLSNSSCFVEIAKDAALYFDPKDINSIVEAMYLIISNPEMRTSMLARGKKRLADFSWKKTVIGTLGVYKQVVKGS